MTKRTELGWWLDYSKANMWKEENFRSLISVLNRSSVHEPLWKTKGLLRDCKLKVPTLYHMSSEQKLLSCPFKVNLDQKDCD